MYSLKQVLAEGGVVIGVDVDTQNDFVKSDGSVYVQSGPDVVPYLRELTRNLRKRIGCVEHHGPDGWEFELNGGTTPVHCLKGTRGAMKIDETMIDDQLRTIPTRFIPISKEGQAMVGELRRGEGPRLYTPDMFVEEVKGRGWAGIFEKEECSLFSNENADPMIEALVRAVGGIRKAYFAVYGYSTGGNSVDAAAHGLADRGYSTGIVLNATAAMNGEAGTDKTIKMAFDKDVEIISAEELLRALGKLSHIFRSHFD